MRMAPLVVFVSLIAAGCGGDDDGGTPVIDARAGALGCIGEELPDTAADPLVLSGQVFNGANDIGVENVDLEVLTRVGSDAVATTPEAPVSDESGDFAITLTTGGEPLDVFLRTEHPAFVTTHRFLPYPAAADAADLIVPIIDPGLYGSLPNSADVEQDPGNGVMLVVPFDCDGNRLEGATVTASEGQLFYAADTRLPDPTLTFTGAEAITWVFNVPPGTVDVAAAVGADSLRSQTVEVFAGDLTAVELRP